MRPVILASSKAIRLRVQSPRGEETPAISSAPQMVTIADATPGAIVYYTTDGTTPSTNSATYSAPILVTKSTTIQAFATAPGYVNSPVTSATYTVAQASTAAVTLATSASTISYGTSITLSATVTGSGGTPTGTVAFLDGGTQLGASAVSAGQQLYRSQLVRRAGNSESGRTDDRVCPVGNDDHVRSKSVEAQGQCQFRSCRELCGDRTGNDQ
jgi:hypothetical protein